MVKQHGAHYFKVRRKLADACFAESRLLFRNIQMSKEFNKLICKFQTGSLEELAKHFRIKESRAMNILVFMIDELKCPIEYDSILRTYFYAGAGELRIGFYPFGS